MTTSPTAGGGALLPLLHPSALSINDGIALSIPTLSAAAAVTTPLPSSREDILDCYAIPLTMNHPGLRSLRYVLVVFGLWRPHNSWRWLGYQLLVFSLVAFFLVCLILGLAGLADEVDAFFVDWPFRVKGAAGITMSSLLLNTLPLLCFAFAFLYLNNHLDWCQLFRYKGGNYGSDEDSHFSRLLRRTSQLRITSKHGDFFTPTPSQPLNLDALQRFQQSVRNLLIRFLFVQVISAGVVATVECISAKSNFFVSFLYFVMMVVYFSPPMCFALLSSAIVSMNRLEIRSYKYLIYACGSGQWTLPRVRAELATTRRVLKESGRHMQAFVVSGVILVFLSFTSLLVQFAFSDEKFNFEDFFAGRLTWQLVSFVLYAYLLASLLRSGASVTKHCQSLSTAACKLLEAYGDRPCEIEQQLSATPAYRVCADQVTQFLLYLKACKMGFYLFGREVLVTSRLLFQIMSLGATLVVLLIQYKLRQV
eukprot:gnl/Hemi2/16384_TR5459_c0_g1_i1.p1 gnl/Hemi2/16384_TR5459_c0_g1~~gnl/Hemi2/16384_TR5459_c0_g1_i1.p1  ORF type:complete len:479 (-),score=101.85 gnl/Hemi2/16384_TR5459_c0_g1_i1:71-1507(-)